MDDKSVPNFSSGSVAPSRVGYKNPPTNTRFKPGKSGNPKGVRQSVLVREDGFEYNGVVYKSLSRVAKEITGTTWNGWRFFHVKRKKK